MTLSLSLTANWCSNSIDILFKDRGKDCLLVCNIMTDVALVVSTLGLAILGLKGMICLSSGACYALVGVACGITIFDIATLLLNETMLKKSGKLEKDEASSQN